jgi:hypothetical protein
MIVQIFLQVSECSLNLVVGIWHPAAILSLIGKEIRQVVIKAVHGCPQPPVRILQPAVHVQAAMFYRALPTSPSTLDIRS